MFVPDEIAKYNCGNVQVVPVIASYNMAGAMRPLYVGINGHSYKILTSTCQNYSLSAIFHCTVNNYGVQRRITLTFHKHENCWTMTL